nr:Ig-like domain-containing protein [Natronospira proteinivora]
MAALACLLLSPLAVAQPDLQINDDFDLVIDQDGDGEVRRGDTLEFELTVTNQGDGNALAVEIDNELHEHLDLDVDSIQISPIAVDDDYPEVPGNSTFPVSAGDGLLANDRALYPEGGSPPGLEVDVADSDNNSAEGGSVSINADGSFEYTPPNDYQGSDSFSYTLVNDHGLSDIATVHLEVTDPVLYVSNSSSTGISACDNTPYSDIQSAIDAFDDEDEIRVCAGSGTYELDQTLLVSDGIVLLGEPTWRGTGSRPTIQAGGGHDGDSPLVELFDDIHVEGFEFDMIAGRTIDMDQSEDVLIRNNRFFTSDTNLEKVEHIIRMGPEGDHESREGWLAIVGNEFELADLKVERGVYAHSIGSAHEVLVEDNEFTGGKYDRLVRLRSNTNNPGDLVAEIRGNTANVAPDLELAGSSVIDVLGRGGIDVHIEDNFIRILGDLTAGDVVDGIAFESGLETEYCIVLDGNDVLFDSKEGDEAEYFFLRAELNPSEPFYLVGLEESTFEKLEEFVRDQDANGSDVTVIAARGQDFDADDVVAPAPGGCRTIENVPAFD